jgi:HSF-type DNA-binding
VSTALHLRMRDVVVATVPSSVFATRGSLRSHFCLLLLLLLLFFFLVCFCSWFRQTKFASFQRQLNLYGFKRLTTGEYSDHCNDIFT